MKKLAFLALLIVFSVALCVNCAAKGYPIQDDAGLLDKEQWQSLCDEITTAENKLDKRHGIGVVTVDYLKDLSDAEIKKEAKYFFDQFEYGLGDDKSGVVLLLDASGMDIFVKIYKNGEADKLFADDKAVSLERKVCTMIANGNAVGGIERFINDTRDALSVQSDNSAGVWIVVSVVAAVVIIAAIVIFVLFKKRQNK